MLIVTAVLALLMQVADSLPPVPPPDVSMQFVLGLGILAAYIGREVGSLAVGVWNKAGGWLDGKSAGMKRVVAIALTGAIGLLVNAVAGALTHSTNWIVTFFLSIVAGFIATVNAGVIISAAESKMGLPPQQRA